MRRALRYQVALYVLRVILTGWLLAHSHPSQFATDCWAFGVALPALR